MSICHHCGRSMDATETTTEEFHHATYTYCKDTVECDRYKDRGACDRYVAKLNAPPSPVNPSHYVTGTYEPRKVIQAWGLNWAMGNAVAYIARAGKKEGSPAADDLSKAVSDLLMELDHMDVDVKALCGEIVGRMRGGDNG